MHAGLSDWYRVSVPQLEEIGPTAFIKKLGLADALKRVYPDHVWENSKFQQASQYWLKLLLKKYHLYSFLFFMLIVNFVL